MPDLPVNTLSWLRQYTGFPARRLSAKAELMVLFAAAAERDAADEAAAAARSKPQKESGAAAVSQRALAFNRTHAHFKSDNRAKV